MVKRFHICFDIVKQRGTARRFLEELNDQNLPIAITSASRPEQIAETQRASLMTARLREVDAVVVLIGPQSAVSKPLAEEIAFARQAGRPIIGILVDGAAVDVNLPPGIDRARVYGWDWGQLARVLR